MIDCPTFRLPAMINVSNDAVNVFATSQKILLSPIVFNLLILSSDEILEIILTNSKGITSAEIRFV